MVPELALASMQHLDLTGPPGLFLSHRPLAEPFLQNNQALPTSLEPHQRRLGHLLHRWRAVPLMLALNSLCQSLGKDRTLQCRQQPLSGSGTLPIITRSAPGYQILQAFGTFLSKSQSALDQPLCLHEDVAWTVRGARASDPAGFLGRLHASLVVCVKGVTQGVPQTERLQRYC